MKDALLATISSAAKTRVPVLQSSSISLEIVENLNKECEKRWAPKFTLAPSLSRSLVSFQANKKRAIYRWFKYKEAFSAGLVEYFLNKFKFPDGILLDPFAGSGTALFAASAYGMKAEGIELLPIGQTLITIKQIIDRQLKTDDIERLVLWRDSRPWLEIESAKPLKELRITKGAYPPETLERIEKFIAASEQENEQTRAMLIFALLCVLESVSFTRRDGQYLRWDYRSGRQQGKKIFNKGKILEFEKAVTEKLSEIITDLQALDAPEDLFATTRQKGNLQLYGGSCLEILPKLKEKSYDCIITSPPYCNRYDYTRTYALELALMGIDEAGILKLRQGMLSCTVENRAKDLLGLNSEWKSAIAATDNQPLLQNILSFLDLQKQLNLLNNNGIARMVRGYFYEMACVIMECARVLKSGAPMVMVNDNVRYAGACISVDIILSEIAEKLGFKTENILVLPDGKGNSSQQMGAHGREPLRKCVYFWRKI